MKNTAFIIMLILVVFSACTIKSDIPLGFLGILTGKLGDLGVSGRDGAILAVENINKDGGINGRNISLFIENNELDADICREKAAKLIELKIEGLIGPMTSDMSLACLDLFNEAEVPMISPTASTPQLSDIDDFFLRVNPSDESEGLELAKYTVNVLKSEKVAVIYNTLNESFTYGVYSKYNEAVQNMKTTQVTAYTFLSTENPNFNELCRTVLSGNPDTVFIIGSAINAGTICQQFYKLSADINLLGTGWAMTDELIKQGGKSVEGMIFNHYHNNNSTSPAYLKFVEQFEKRFSKTPDFIAALGYNAVNVWAEAYKTKEKYQSIKERILEIGTFQGLQGEIKINEFGDAFLERHYISVRNGAFIDI